MEHVYRLSFPQLNERLYLSGFIDHTINQKSSTNVPSDPIVMETQLGFRIVENLFAVTEYRSNQVANRIDRGPRTTSIERRSEGGRPGMRAQRAQHRFFV